jgi:hypothetical protein
MLEEADPKLLPMVAEDLVRFARRLEAKRLPPSTGSR